MRPLSVFKFIKGSLPKILPLAIGVCLAVALLYFLSISVSHIIDQNVELAVTPLSNMSVLGGTGDKVSDVQLNKDLTLLKSNADIAKWYVVNVRTVNFWTPSSNNDMFFIQMENKNIASLMKWQKLKLIEGSMPEKPYEVLLHKKLANNYGLKLGDTIKKNTEGWSIDHDLKFVGIFDGPAIMGIGDVDAALLTSGKVNISVLTVAGDEKVSEMNRFVEQNFGGRYDVQTMDMAKKAIDDKNKNINIIMVFVGIVVVIVLSVLLGNMCMIQYTQRNKEFELLHAIGYSKGYIYRKVFKEIGISTILGYVCGITASVILAWLLNVCLLNDKGLTMPLVRIENMLWILLVPIVITVSGMMVPINMLKFRDIT